MPSTGQAGSSPSWLPVLGRLGAGRSRGSRCPTAVHLWLLVACKHGANAGLEHEASDAGRLGSRVHTCAATGCHWVSAVGWSCGASGNGCDPLRSVELFGSQS